MIAYPQETIPMMDLVVNELYQHMFPASSIDQRIQVRTYNLKITNPMRDLDPKDIDTMVSIKGMIIRASPIIPDLKRGKYRILKRISIQTYKFLRLLILIF